ncbi:iron-containing alcohol dehydrogenase family protein [Clostridium sp. WILCCON 0269]|uniref:Iron-containing alcohol dehydrogenase family protein n=1 Tax=Candidatus Clostridium eludens TaxID=3381663 RepID=A0ABW8SIF7_9CLOT
MIRIKTPEVYVNEINALEKSGEYISKLGNYALIVGGKSALQAVEKKFFKSFNKEKIQYYTEEYSGYCTFKAIDKYTELANKLGVNLIIGVGGGTILDLAKAIGERANLYVVTIPTIAATCAAWSALSVIYNENGEHTDYFLLEKSPKLVLVDISVIKEAPIRYLNAGIGDTIAKWYEIVPNLSGNNDINLKIGLQTAKLALDILKNYINGLHKKSDDNDIGNQQYKDVIDSIIILAGFVGSINNGKHIAAMGHAIHDSFTHIPDTKYTLHGEKVIFGLIVQFLLEGKDDEEIEGLIDVLNKLKLPVTLQQLGIEDDVNKKILSIVNGVDIHSKELDKLNFKVNSTLIKEAIIKANRLGIQSLNKASSNK